MENVMSTTFKFVFESAGGGSTPENVAAQTGDWLTMLLVALFAVAAVASLIFAFVKTKNSKNFASSAGHAAAKTAMHSKTIVAVIIAALAIAGICVSVANAPALRAFANGNAEGVDYKPQITATVHEDTQTVTFEQNYFTNLEANPIHIDHSSLTLSDEAKAVVGDDEFYFEAKYVGEETRVFAGDTDSSEDCKPVDQDALPNSQTQQIEYNTNITYEIAKKLCDIEEAFTLDLVPAECYTIDFSAEGADGGQPPHVQTITAPGQEGMEQTIIYAPANTGNLVKEGYVFNGWNTQLDGKGTHYDVDGPITGFTKDSVIYVDWKRVAKWTVTFEATEGGNVDKNSLSVEPYLAINVSNTTLNIGSQYSVTATAEAPKYKFEKWVIVEATGEREIGAGETVTGPFKFRAKFVFNTFDLSFQTESTDKGTVSPESLSDVLYGTAVKTNKNVIYFGDFETATNKVTATAKSSYDFEKWQYKDGAGWKDLQGGETITSAMTFRATFKLNAFTITFESEDANKGTVSPTSLSNITYETAIHTDKNVIYFGESQTTTNICTATNKPNYVFDKWVYMNGTTEVETLPEKVTSAMTFRAKFKLESYSLTFEKPDPDQGSISPESLSGTFDYGTPIKLTGTDNSTIYFGQSATDANKVVATPKTEKHYLFDKWVIVDGSSEQEITSSSIVTKAMTFRAKFKLQTFTVDFAADANGYVYEAGTTKAPTTQTVPYGATWSISEDEASLNYLIISWKEGQTDKTYKVQPVGKTDFKFKEWTNEIPTNDETAITANIKFTANFEMQTAILTYKVVNEDNPHGGLSKAAGGDILTSFTEEIKVDGSQTPTGAFARTTSQPSDKYQYYFVNWTQDDEEISTDSHFVPQPPTNGVWADATYVIHFATPRAIYSENQENGDKILNFTYDEEDHNEAYQSNNGKNNTFKFVVNNSEFNLTEDLSSSTITVPSWYNSAVIGKSGITTYPTPKVQPTKIIIDSSFKKYNGLTSTDMWFMDSGAIPALLAIVRDVEPSYINLNSFETRKIQSIEGLENVPTQNLVSSNLMFTNGKAVLSEYMDSIGHGVGEIPSDGISSLDLSGWTNFDKFTGNTIGMFAGCNSLMELKLPGGQFGAKTKDMSGMFAGCSSLTSFTTFNNFGEAAENALGMYFCCTSLRDFNIGTYSNAQNLFGKAITNFKYMFLGCSNLAKVNLSTCNKNPKDVEQIFWHDYDLVTMMLPVGWAYSSSYMGLDTGGSTWYKDLGEGEYEEYSESDIQSANGGTLTRDSAKAIYVGDDLVFYFDHVNHEEGPSFTVQTGGGHGIKNIASFFPSWYDFIIKIDGQTVTSGNIEKLLVDPNSLTEKSVESDITLNAPATNVIFDDSFVNVEGLTNLNYWFIADSHGHNNCFQNFYSYDYDNGTRGPENAGFANLNTSEVYSAVNMFGGFSFENFEMIEIGQAMPYESYDYNDKYLSSADTFSVNSGTLDLSTLKFYAGFYYSIDLSALCCNSTGLTKIILPSGKIEGGPDGSSAAPMRVGVAALMFSNCSSLTEIVNLDALETESCGCYTKMFYGCSSITSLNLSKFVSWNIKEEQNFLYCFMFTGCNKLKQFTTSENWVLNMDVCGLPYDANNSWHNSKYGDETYFDPSLIPSKTADGKPLYYGNFYRSEATPKTVTFSVEGTGGTIQPAEVSVNIYGDTNFYLHDGTININNQQIVAVPEAGNRVKSWKLNGERIAEATFASDMNVIKYKDNNAFTVSFIDEGITPKAIYDSTQETLTFYYDKLPHTGEGEYFEVNNNTHFNVNMDNNSFSYTIKMPAWYDYSISGDFNSDTDVFNFNTSLKINAKTVIFSKSFEGYDDLESISMWFMADSLGKQSFEKFYSPDENGQISDAVEGFANLNTTNLNNVRFAFGGFSMLPYLIDARSTSLVQAYTSGKINTVLKQITTYIPVYSSWDTYGTAIKNIDLSTFDKNHNLKDYSAMFCNCRGLDQVIFPSDINEATITNLESTFQNCEAFGMNPDISLPIVNLDKLNTSSVKNMNLMFYGDFGIKSLNLSNFDTSGCIYRDGVSLGKSVKSKVHLDNWLMFYDCTRLSELTLSSRIMTQAELTEQVLIPVVGWCLPLDIAQIPETKNLSGDVNKWTNADYPDQGPWDTYEIPYSYNDLVNANNPLSMNVYTGTFKRDPATEYTTRFSSSDKSKGTVNGKDQVDYNYIRNDTVKVDPKDPASLICDNYRITAVPTNNSYRFSHWEYFESPTTETGQFVTEQDEFYFEADKHPENIRKFVAVFEESNRTAKAVYTKPDAADLDKVATMKFVYDDETYEDATAVFDVIPNANMTNNLPKWYKSLGVASWVTDETRPMRAFVDEIDDPNGINTPKLIKVEFDESFADYKNLTSLAGWFAPGISNVDVNKLYHPFVFGENEANENCFAGLENINTTNIYNVEYMFGGHENSNEISGAHVKSIDLTGFDTTHNLKNINGLFAGCLDLETLTLPENFGINCTSMSKTFMNCKKLTGDKLATALNQLNIKSATDMSYMFARYKNVDSVAGYPSEETTTLTFPDGFFSNIANAEGMFSGYTDTQHLVINTEGEVTSLSGKILNAEYMFANTTKFSSVFEDVNLENSPIVLDSATSMKGMFKNCDNLTSLNFIGKYKKVGVRSGDNLKDTSYMFSGCKKLAQANWESYFNTEHVTTMDHMFEYTAFTNVDFEAAEESDRLDTSNLTTCSYMFYGCENLESVNLRRTIDGDSIPIQDARFMFGNCPKLEKAQLCYFYVNPSQVYGTPTNPLSAYWPAENMFSLNDDGYVYDNPNINSVTIGDKWSSLLDIQGKSAEGLHPLDIIGIPNTDINTGENVKWYIKFIPFNEPVTLDALIELAEEGEYEITTLPPKQLQVQSNRNYWGSVQTFPQEKDQVVSFYDEIKLQTNSSDGDDSLSYSYNPIMSFSLKPEAMNNSHFDHWEYVPENGTEGIAITKGTSVTLTANATIVAVFEGGDKPFALILSEGNAKALGINTTEPNPGEEMMGFAILNEDFIREMGIPEADYQEVPANGDWGEDGPFYATEANKHRYSKVAIVNNMRQYSDFTTFKGWFKGLYNLQGDAFPSMDPDKPIPGLANLNFANVESIEEMFAGCTNLTKIDFNQAKISTKNQKTINATNAFSGCSNLKDLGLGALTKYTDETTNVFKDSNAIDSLTFTSPINKNIADLGFDNTKQLICSGQTTLAASTASDIQSKLPSTSLGGKTNLFTICTAKESVSVSSTDSIGKFCDTPNGEFVETMNIYFNEDAGIMVGAIDNGESLQVVYIQMYGEQYISQWEVVVYTQNQLPDTKMFYYWKLNEGILSEEGTLLNNEDYIIAYYDVPKQLYASFDDTHHTLNIRYDGDGPSNEAEKITVPNQWSASSTVKERGPVSPFESIKDQVYTVVFDSSFKTCPKLYDTYAWFKDFTNLTSVTGLTNLYLVGAKPSLEYMFAGCSQLTEIDFEGTQAKYTLATFAHMFDGCTSLQSVDLSPFALSSQESTNTTFMFNNCPSLKEVYFGQNWLYHPLSLCGYNGDELWITEDGVNVDTNSFPNIGGVGAGAFEKGDLKASIGVDDPAHGYIKGQQKVCFTELRDAKYKVNENNTLSIFIKKNDEGYGENVVIAKNYAGWISNKWTLNDNSLEPGTEGSVSAGDSFVMTYIVDKNTAIAVYSTDDPWNGTLTLKYVDLAEEQPHDPYMPVPTDWVYESSPFEQIVNRDALKHIVIDSSFANVSTINSFSGWFCEYYNVEDISGIENLSGSTPTDTKRMFCGCSSLTSLDVSRLDTSKVQDMSFMFCALRGLQTLKFKDASGQSLFDTQNVEYFDSCIRECESLTSLDLSTFTFKGYSGHVSLSVFVYYLPKLVEVDLRLKAVETSWIDYAWDFMGSCDRVALIHSNGKYIYEHSYLQGNWIDPDGNYFGPYDPFNKNGDYVRSTDLVFKSSDSYGGYVQPDSTISYYPNQQNGRYDINGDTITITLTNVDGTGTPIVETRQAVALPGSTYSFKDWSIDPVSTTGEITSSTTFTANFKDSLKARGYYDESNQTLTFYYDDGSGHGDLPYVDVPKDWINYESPFVRFCDQAVHVIFDQSFYNFKGIKSLYSWFNNFYLVEDYTGLEFLDLHWLLSSNPQGNSMGISQMFRNNYALKSLDLYKIDTNHAAERIWYMYQLCENCYNLETVNLYTTELVDGQNKIVSNFDVTYAGSCSSLFRNCYKLKRVDFSYLQEAIIDPDPYNKDMNWYYCGELFDGCYSLEYINLGPIKIPSWSGPTNLFRGCYSLKTLIIGANHEGGQLCGDNIFVQQGIRGGNWTYQADASATAEAFDMYGAYFFEKGIYQRTTDTVLIDFDITVDPPDIKNLVELQERYTTNWGSKETLFTFTKRPVPEGTIVSIDPEDSTQCKTQFTDQFGIVWDVGTFRLSSNWWYVQTSWTFEGSQTITPTSHTLTGKAWSTLLQRSTNDVANNLKNNGSSLPEDAPEQPIQPEPLPDEPVDPQVDPAVPEPEDAAGAAAALMAAAPALAFLGMRKRLRGKHVRLK